MSLIIDRIIDHLQELQVRASHDKNHLLAYETGVLITTLNNATDLTLISTQELMCQALEMLIPSEEDVTGE